MDARAQNSQPWQCIEVFRRLPEFWWQSECEEICRNDIYRQGTLIAFGQLEDVGVDTRVEQYPVNTIELRRGALRGSGDRLLPCHVDVPELDCGCPSLRSEIEDKSACFLTFALVAACHDEARYTESNSVRIGQRCTLPEETKTAKYTQVL